MRFKSVLGKRSHAAVCAAILLVTNGWGEDAARALGDNLFLCETVDVKDPQLAGTLGAMEEMSRQFPGYVLSDDVARRRSMVSPESATKTLQILALPREEFCERILKSNDRSKDVGRSRISRILTSHFGGIFPNVVPHQTYVDFILAIQGGDYVHQNQIRNTIGALLEREAYAGDVSAWKSRMVELAPRHSSILSFRSTLLNHYGLEEANRILRAIVSTRSDLTDKEKVDYQKVIERKKRASSGGLRLIEAY